MSVTLSFQKVDPRDEVLMKEVYRIRYQVYCLECGFEDPKDHPDGMERDKYDPYAIHFLAMDENGPIGTIRLIRDSYLKFPVEKHCKVNMNPDKVPREKLGEISRLAVSKRYQRRVEDRLAEIESDADTKKKTALPHLSDKEEGLPDRRRHADISLSLYRMVYQESKELGIKYWYAAMGRGLQRLLKKFNFVFDQIGDEVDYHGPRIPFLGNIQKMGQAVAADRPEIYDKINRSGKEEVL